jgi:L-ribulokinase
MANSYALGVDYGTNSVRALVVDVATGEELATEVYEYRRGEAGILLDGDPNTARQSPADYVDGFFASVSGAIQRAKATSGFSADRIVGIGVDTTGSTPLPVDEEGVPLAFQKEFADDLAAQAWLWKDHTSHAEAQEITDAAQSGGYPYLAKCGGAYSSEWYWSKILHCARTVPHVAEAAASWVELADFVPAYITGNLAPTRIVRSVCAAGHKAMYHPDWNGLPAAEFLDSLHKGMSRFRYESRPLCADKKAGELSPEAAEKTGLRPGIPVAAGAFDAHMGAVGAGIRPGTLVKIIGTSTCDCMVAPLASKLPDVPGLCGIVPESILPGMYGLEAGQSAVGDIFNWFVKQLTPAEYGTDAAAHQRLSAEAGKLRPGQSGLVALDWNNGNRTVLVDPLLTGLLIGQTLHTTAAEIYRALVESTAFGALTIINRLDEYGVKVDQVINCGGIAEKSDFVMQIYADVCQRPMKVSRSAQTCALGAAIFGSVVGGAHASVAEAQDKMTGVKAHAYMPNPKHSVMYNRLYQVYRQLHDAFGGVTKSSALGDVMKTLIAIRSEARQAQA